MHIPSEKELFKAGVHFGHKPSNWHPKMAEFIFGQRNNVHIIDLDKTRKKLEEALNFVKEITAQDGQILFIGTKVQAQAIVKKYAQSAQMPFVTERWLGGTLTNFKVINGLVKQLDKLEKQSQEEDYEKKYTKKERHDFSLEIERLSQMIGGIRQMVNRPAAVYVASARNEKTAVNEAIKRDIPVIAICDTNSNPTRITYPIPGNDDALKSIELITSLVVEAIKEGKK